MEELMSKAIIINKFGSIENLEFHDFDLKPLKHNEKYICPSTY